MREEVAGRPWHTFRMGVPALAYTVQGNLLFVALAHLEAPTYQVLAQGKTLFTALFSWLIIGRQLRASQVGVRANPSPSPYPLTPNPQP